MMFAVAMGGTAAAQLSAGGVPQEAPQSALKTTHGIPVVEMPPVERKTVPDQKGNTSVRRCEFAHKFKVDIDVKKQGRKFTAGEMNVWQVAIKSDSAKSLNIIFEKMDVPPGARLFLFSPGKDQIAGAYTEKNNTLHRFATTPIDGDQLVIQYEEPKGTEKKVRVVVKDVNHDYKGIFLKGLPEFDVSEACEVDAVSDELHLGAKSSSCQLIIDGYMHCSGNLINNTAGDANPYIISSGHCLWPDEDTYEVDTALAATVVAFFNYESPGTELHIAGTREMSLSGARVVAHRNDRDLLLLRMNDMPPADYRPYWAGWEKTDKVNGPVYAFHHPCGDVKKVSSDGASPSVRTMDAGLFQKNGHFQVYRWDNGITEGGSSGAALFNSADRIVGALSGGNKNLSCTVPGDDYFWRMDGVWDDAKNTGNNIGYWLDPLQGGTEVLDGFTPYMPQCVRLGQRQKADLPAADSAQSTYGYPAGTNTLGNTEFAERFTPGKAGTLYGVYFFPETGGYNANAPVRLRVYDRKLDEEHLVHEEVLRITTSQYRSYYKTFYATPTTTWAGMENYFRTDSLLSLSDTFYVSFLLPGAVVKGDRRFALFHSMPHSSVEDNTAYFKNSKGTWQPYMQHPQVKAPLSLMVEAVWREGSFSAEDTVPLPDVPPLPIDPRDTASYGNGYVFYPAVVKDNMIYMDSPKGETLKSLQIVDAVGRTVYEAKNVNGYATYAMDISAWCRQRGFYVVKAEYTYKDKHYKFIKW